jgi:hypothetical protein
MPVDNFSKGYSINSINFREALQSFKLQTFIKRVI